MVNRSVFSFFAVRAAMLELVTWEFHSERATNIQEADVEQIRKTRIDESKYK